MLQNSDYTPGTVLPLVHLPLWESWSSSEDHVLQRPHPAGSMSYTKAVWELPLANRNAQTLTDKLKVSSKITSQKNAKRNVPQINITLAYILSYITSCKSQAMPVATGNL